MCNRYAKLVETDHFKYQIIVGCEYLKYREDEPDEYAIIPSSMNQIVNLTKIQLNDFIPQWEIGNQIHTVEMVGSGLKLQRILFLEMEYFRINGVLE